MGVLSFKERYRHQWGGVTAATAATTAKTSITTTGMIEAAADVAIGVFGVVGMDDITRTAVDNMEVAARAGEATDVTAVVEVIAVTAGMTEAAAYTTAGAAVAAGVAETTSTASFGGSILDKPKGWKQKPEGKKGRWCKSVRSLE